MAYLSARALQEVCNIADRFNEVACCELSYRRKLNQVVIGASPTGVFINGQTPVHVRDVAYCPTVGQTVLQANCPDQRTTAVLEARAPSCVCRPTLGIVRSASAVNLTDTFVSIRRYRLPGRLSTSS